MIDPSLGIHAYALYSLTFLLIVAIALVISSIPSADLPFVPVKLFRIYMLLGVVGWAAGAFRDIGGTHFPLSWSVIFYVVCTLILYLAVSSCAKRYTLRRSVVGMHLMILATILFLPDDYTLMLFGSVYALVAYTLIAFFSGELARAQKNLGHALIGAAAGIVAIGSAVQLYLLAVHSNVVGAYGISFVTAAIGFLLVGVGFLSAVLLNEHMKMMALALNDPLTGLLNRRGLDQSLYTLMGLSERNKLDISAITIDIDHFKKINDTHGHDGGDIVLKKVADLLSHARRGSDVCCRMGGEEFVIVLPDTSVDKAAFLAERIRADLQTLEIRVNNTRVPVTASFGVAGQDSEPDLDSLLKDADKALYRAKELGRNRVVLASQLA